MTQDNERKVKRGEKFRFPAATYNHMVDVIRKYKRNQGNEGIRGDVTDLITPSNTILIKNTLSEGDIGPFRVVRLTQSTVDLPDNDLDFTRRVAIGVDYPTGPEDAIAITHEPILADEYGHAVINGITIAFVLMNDPGHLWANPTVSSTGYLESVDCGGQARIIETFDVEGQAENVKGAVINLIGNVGCETQLEWDEYVDNNLFGIQCPSNTGEVSYYLGSSENLFNSTGVVLDANSIYEIFISISAVLKFFLASGTNARAYLEYRLETGIILSHHVTVVQCHYNSSILTQENRGNATLHKIIQTAGSTQTLKVNFRTVAAGTGMSFDPLTCVTTAYGCIKKIG